MEINFSINHRILIESKINFLINHNFYFLLNRKLILNLKLIFDSEKKNSTEQFLKACIKIMRENDKLYD